MNRRLVNLDHARGFAALVVVVFHALLYSGFLLNDKPEIGDVLAVSPLAWTVSGGGAVLVFFVLSGFVLDRATQFGFEPSTKKWIFRRLLRLYLPIYPILFLVFLVSFLVNQGPYRLELLEKLALDSTLVFGHGNLLGVLWSLRWEIIYSILLPFAAWFFNRFVTRVHLIHIALAIAASMLGNFLNFGFAQYLPMIFAGFLLSRNVMAFEKRAMVVSRSNSRESNLKYISMLLISLLMIGFELQLDVLVRVFDIKVFDGWAIIGQAVSLTGSVLLVRAVYSLPSFKGFGAKVLDFLGKTSFSLYLVHGPIVLLTAQIFHSMQYLAILMGVALSLVAGWLYFEKVELPTLKLVRKLRGV